MLQITRGKGLLIDYIAGFNARHLPTQLIFFVTSGCNHQCFNCFYWKNLNLRQNELSLNEISRISLSLNTLSRLLISGGEPFLRKDLPDICFIFYSQNHIKGINIPTNGSLTETVIHQSELMLKKCKGAEVTIGLSLDGLEETHDCLRQRPGSFKSVIKTLKGLSALKEHYPNLSLHIISVVSDKNVDEIAVLMKFLYYNFDIDSFGPNPLRGDPKDKTLLPPTRQEWDSLFKELSVYYKRLIAKKYNSLLLRRFYYAQRRYLDKITGNVLDGKPLPFSCKAGDNIAVLEPDGDVRLCELTDCIGNLRAADFNFKKVWFSPEAEIARRRIKGCACTHGCFLSPGIALSPYHLLRSLINI